MIDDRATANVQLLDAFLEIVVAVVGKEWLVPPFGLWGGFALDDARDR
jgi:hypothetical protein